jgi:hypothetical protein
MNIQILMRNFIMGRNGCVFKYHHEVVWCNPTKNLYFEEIDLSPKETPPGLYLGNPNKTTMGSISVNRLKNIMKTRNVDVEVVTLPSILGSTEYKKKLFLIQGYARRRKKLKKTRLGYPNLYPCGEQKKEKTKMILFLNTQFYLNHQWVDTLIMFYVAKTDASF